MIKGTKNSSRASAAGFTMIEIMIVILITGILIAIATPVWIRARTQSRMKSCQENLSKIDGAKEQWALENRKRVGDTVAESDIVNPNPTTGYLKAIPREPSGFTYTIGVVGSDPVCSSALDGHSATEVGMMITTTE